MRWWILIWSLLGGVRRVRSNFKISEGEVPACAGMTYAMERIYLDHAAATPLDARVKEVMLPYFDRDFGNPSSLHQEGRVAKKAVEDSRVTIAKALHALPEELVFTGSGTESCNLAIKGVAYAKMNHGKHIVTSRAEHHAVLAVFEFLQQAGWEVTYIDVDEFGMVQPPTVKDALREDTVLVSIMMANNEVGTINSIKEISKVIKKHNPEILFHTDACQAMGALELNVKKLGIDLLTINGSKIYGPKGVGALYVQRGVSLVPIVSGGGQEKALRSGTENVSAIVGFAKAVELSEMLREKDAKSQSELRDYLIQGLKKVLPEIQLNGHPSDRLPNNVNMSLPGVEGEVLVIYLDQAGISASTSSACTTASSEPSHVLLAMGRSKELAKASIRFTLGRSTTKEEIDSVIHQLPKLIETIK